MTLRKVTSSPLFSSNQLLKHVPAGFARSMAGYIVGIIEKHLSQTFSAHVNPRTAAFLCQPLATLIEILLEPYRLSPAAQRLHLALKEDPSTDPRPYLDELKRTDRGAWLYLISEGTSSYVGVAQCFSARMGTYDSELKAGLSALVDCLLN